MSDRLVVPCTNVAELAVALAAIARGSPESSIPAHGCVTIASLGCADEAGSQRTLMPACDDCCPTDASFDGVTDSADLGLLLACRGPLLPDCECADLNGDGSVGGADVGRLLAAWGPCPSEITFSIATTLSMVIGAVDTGDIPDCSPANTLDPFVVAGFCGMAKFQACLPPGAYRFFAAPIAFSGFPCGTQNDHAITLACGAGY